MRLGAEKSPPLKPLPLSLTLPEEDTGEMTATSGDKEKRMSAYPRVPNDITAQGRRREGRLQASAIAFKSPETEDTDNKKRVRVREMAGGAMGGSCFASSRRGLLIGSSL